MTKHAYLILAHHQFDVLEKLLTLLDDERNDLFVHVDASAGPFDRARLEAAVTRSTLTFTDRVPITWGGYNMVAAELILLRAATAAPHDHYHLISGSDLPLGTPDELHAFFAEHAGQEFVHFELDTDVDVEHRVRYWHPFSEILGKDPSYIVGKLGYIALRIQQLLRVDRRRRVAAEFRYGSSWYSITHDLATTVLAHAASIERQYRWTLCPDEQFLQTLVWNSRFRHGLHQDPSNPSLTAISRLVDFARGNGRGSPYTFRDAEYAEVLGSGMWFARKFESAVDAVVIDRVVDAVNSRRAQA